MKEEANIAVYDPKVSENKILADLDYLESRKPEQNRKGVSAFEDAYAACKNAHAIAVLTEWDEFKDYDWQRIYDAMEKPAFVFDGRNIYDTKELNQIGFEHYGIGTKKIKQWKEY